MKALTVTSIISLGLLVGCGGGGGGSDSGGGTSTPPAAVPDPAPEPTPTPVAEAERTMEDLSIPDDFDYQPIEEYSLTVDATNDVNGRAFISVYTEYNENASGDLEPNYESKVASQALSDGKGELSFNAAEHVGSFLVEIWTYDGNAPVKKLVKASNKNLSW
ncbi:hypothetical protein [Vibrio sp. 10N]|uniref:hypothetical protein n=1 Tax=Vibrio sp. 10N TaxID=3058938 RepID=UPI0028143FCA|nr:hypothetical protein VB10N_37540 [Vibrio sp. 10N]